MQTIDTESRQRIRMPIDIDFMGERYKTDNNLYSFTSPSLWTIEKNYHFLLKNSVEVDLEKKYVGKPWLLSYDQYNTVTLEFLLMYVNGVYCIEEFDIPTVILPSLNSIISICQDKYSKVKDVSKLTSVLW